VPSRAAALTGSWRAAFLAQHVELRQDGELVRRGGHFAAKPIKGERFLVAGRQFETAAVKSYLKTGSWSPPRLQGRRKGGGYVSANDNRAADARLMALMAEQPEAGVRQLAAMLGVSHPAISRRIGKLKAIGMASRDDGQWLVDAPNVKTQCDPWVPSLRVKVRGYDEDCSVCRYG
jgi:hypothetical protein